MSLNKNLYWRAFSIFLTKNKVDNRNITTHKITRLFPLRAITTLILSALVFVATSAFAVSITSEMSPEIAAEFEKQLAAQTSWPDKHTKLAFMDNPYKKFDRAIKKKLRKEAPEGKKRRLKTHEESILSAKKMRFDHCQAAINFFVDFAKRANDLTIVEENPLTKEELMAGNGVTYPFIDAETNNGKTRPTQVALQLGWEHKGQGEKYAEKFLTTCLSIPVSLYYKEDK